MMIDSSSSSSKSKLELKLIGPQSSRNQLRQSNNMTNGNLSTNSQMGFNTTCNTARNQQNVTPKRQNSNHNGNSVNQASNFNINQNNMNACNTASSNYSSLLNGTPSSLNTQMNNRMQGNSYLNKTSNNGSSVSKLSNQNFSKKSGSGLGSNLGSTKSYQNNQNHHSGSIVGNYTGSSLNQNQGSTFSKEKMNTVMKNNMSKQKTNSNMHMTHKNQILQQYQASQQQFIQQQLQQLSYANNQQSHSQLNQLMDQSPNQTYHLSPSTSQQQINTNENTKVKSSYLSSKPTSPHSYLGNSDTQGNSKNFQKFSQPSNIKESGYFSNPFGQSLSSTNNSKSNKCMTPINEKSSKSQNSYLKKSQLIVTSKNQNSSNMLNTSTNNSNTSFLKQSHSRSPLSSNHIEKENNYLSHFDSSSLYINEKSKRMSQAQQQSQSQSHLQQSPFSYLSSGHASSINNQGNTQNTSHLNNLSGMSKSKSSKSPKQSNSLQMVTQSLETPAGNFFSSHLSRKKNLSTVNYNSFTQNIEKQSSSSSSQQNQQQSYTMSTQHNFDSSPISNTRRMNQFNKNESSEMLQSNGQNSFLLSSNLKDNNQELIQNKTHDYGSYNNNKNSGFLSHYPNSSRFDQYRSVDGCSEGQNNRNFFPKTYLNIETKDSYVSLKKKNITMGGEMLNGIGQNKSSNGILTTDNNFITLNEQELSFQNDQEDNIMMMINQQNHNQTNIQPGNSYCYGYYNEDESNFLNSTNFLNLTNLQINTQNNTMIAMSNNYNNNNKDVNNYPNKNSSTNGSQVLQQNYNGTNTNNNIYQQYNMGNNNNNDNIGNANLSMQQNNLSNTLNWTNSTNLFNNSVCAGSMLNTTINNILQNMNSTQSTNNTLSGNPNFLNSNNPNSNAKAAPNIYSSLSQQNSNTNPTNTNANNTPTNTNNNNQGNSFSQAVINNISIPANGQTDKLPLDTTPKQVSLFPEPIPNKNQCSSLKSILYDYVMPTIKPITRQFKLLSSHQQNNSQSNFQQSINLNTNNIFGNESLSNQNKQQILSSLNKQLSSKNLSNNASAANLNSSSNNINNTSSIVENNNCLVNSSCNMNNFNNFKNPFNFDDQKSENYSCSQGFPSSNFLDLKEQQQTQQSQQQIYQQLGESQNSNQATPIKIHLKVDSQSVNSFNKNNLFSQNQGTPAMKSPSNKDDNIYYQNQGTPQMKSPTNKQEISSSNHQLTPSSQGNGGKLTFCNNPTIIISSEKDQLTMQQYNFSFSNCVNQQKKIQQQQQQAQEQQEQKQQSQNTLHPNQIFSSPQKNLKKDDEKKKGSSQKKGNLLINQEHRLVESSKQEYSTSPEKPVINILLSQQITVVDGISQVSSQMFNIEQPDPFVDQSLIQNFWSIDSFQIGKCLGRGRFGNVYLSRHKLTNMLFAIKQISKKNLIESCMEKQLQQEIKIQTYLNHPNVLKMHGFFDDSQKIYLILELASHGDIYKEIKREANKKFTEEKAANYIRQVCEGLIYLHSQGIIHRDIKPENILNSYGVLKLSDFGWSIYTEEKRMTFCGTLDYVSPEVVSGKDYDFKVDIWSIGVLTYELITGKPPFENRQNHNEAYQKILMVKYDFPNYISKEAKDFMSKLLVGDPNKRISLETALNHEWILKNTRNCLADWDPKVSEACLCLLK
ncbi:Serine/Threonine kinase domain protein (macronuclear) [Tetrahymena thermophila SB210]|uniref:Aurora kinase n=1 Tax=Tetrahymena thermophila (strain SB210) TaxID=312017 RepID=Q22DW7_TETTS|nr:Serine/Threonine kinase domain protein [Tetrahymena thermophila SB210]EAR83438.2 Serine/Threonine kinase domain protein [Tetrahymena thermophila SB210]|eukprot:XP_001031101.2 Serine/Threonine kinase domain protein [Tetrahymena thermophila SB210]